MYNARLLFEWNTELVSDNLSLPYTYIPPALPAVLEVNVVDAMVVVTGVFDEL